MTITQERLATLFTEWLRRYNEDPAEFQKYGDTLSYGESSARYLMKLDAEVKA